MHGEKLLQLTSLPATAPLTTYKPPCYRPRTKSPGGILSRSAVICTSSIMAT